MLKAFTLVALFLPCVLGAQVTIGPDAPNMAITYDPAGGEFTYALWNPSGSNNYGEAYMEWIDEPVPTPDQYWRFQGYAIYQFRSTADADDSLHLVIRDPARAKPVLIVDRTDTIYDMLLNLYTDGPDSCTAFTYGLDNTGLASEHINSFDPFTTLGYFEDSTYCFLAVAFAYNTYHESATCDTLQQVIFSKRSPAGSLQAFCVDLATVGIREPGTAGIVLSPSPAANDLSIMGLAGARYYLRCVSVMGSLMLDRSVRSGETIDVSMWPSGAYHATVRDAQGKSVRRTVVVAH